MKRIDSRELDRRIAIERDGPLIHDGVQSIAGAPVVLATRWASMRPGGGRERFANAENAASAVMVFRLRWDTLLDPEAPGGVGPGDRIRHPVDAAGALYDIKSAEPFGRREGITISTVRRVG